MQQTTGQVISTIKANNFAGLLKSKMMCRVASRHVADSVIAKSYFL